MTGVWGSDPVALDPRGWGWMTKSHVSSNYKQPFWNREKEMLLSDRHARRADLMLVLGSSLVVEPAASLVGLAVRSGAQVVLVNRGETHYDHVVTMRLWDGIADVLPPTVQRVKEMTR